MFNLQVDQPISILGMDVHAIATSSIQVKVYLKSGAYTTGTNNGFDASHLIYDSTVVGAGQGIPTNLPGFTAQELAIPGTYSMHVYMSNTCYYKNGSTEGSVFATNPGELL